MLKQKSLPWIVSLAVLGLVAACHRPSQITLYQTTSSDSGHLSAEIVKILIEKAQDNIVTVIQGDGSNARSLLTSGQIDVVLDLKDKESVGDQVTVFGPLMEGETSFKAINNALKGKAPEVAKLVEKFYLDDRGKRKGIQKALSKKKNYNLSWEEAAIVALDRLNAEYGQCIDDNQAKSLHDKLSTKINELQNKGVI